MKRAVPSLAMLEPAGSVFGVIGEDDGGAGALNAGEDFERNAFFVDPAVARGGLYHRVFAAHVVGGDGYVEMVADTLDYIQISQRGLYHDHVRALFQVELDFAYRLARVARIHLVAAPVTELGRGIRRFAEWSVERRAVFRRVGKNRDILKFIFVELAPDRGDAAVHHVRGRDDIGSSARMRKRGVGEQSKAGIVENVFALDHAAMSMARVFAKANVGDHE